MTNLFLRGSEKENNSPVIVFHKIFSMDLGYDLFAYDLEMLPQTHEYLDLSSYFLCTKLELKK